MGYDTHILIGELGSEMPELESDLDNPFEDGSGYPYKRDENGDYIKTGRVEHYFMKSCEIDMSKIYESTLSQVHGHYKENPMLSENHFVYLFGSDGNTRITKDFYGDAFVVAPFIDVMEAVRKDAKKSDYRRFKWLLALMEAMEGTIDLKRRVCVFYGS